MSDITLPQGSKALINLKDGPQGNAGTATREFYNFLRQLATLTGNAELQAEIDAIIVRLEELENASDFLISGPASVQVLGQPSDGSVVLTLRGDSSAPDPESYYGTDELGVRGFHVFPIPPDTAMPFFIPDGETYTVAENKQGLFTIPIDLGAGSGLLIDGILAEVD